MKRWLLRFKLTGDRLLFVALGLLALIVLGSVLFVPPALPPLAQSTGDTFAFDTEQTMNGRVTQILAEETIETEFGAQHMQLIEVEITSGAMKGQRVDIEHGGMVLSTKSSQLRADMRVVINHTEGPAGERWYISSIVRHTPVLALTILFVIVTVGTGHWTGLRSLIGLAFSILVLVRFILPRILAGQNPVGVSIIGALILMAPSLYIVYGWKGKTHAAVLGMSVSLISTWLLAAAFVSWTMLSGFSDESMGFLVVATQVELDPRGLVLAGIILGTLGMLDDIAIGLASAVFELAGANPDLPWQALFKRSMVIGVDHFASMVNSLMLAYVGASLPLFLLLTIYQEPLGFTLNRELFVEEIVRTLVGGIGLMLTGPITSLIACWMVKRKQTGTHPILHNTTETV
ncbi:MAG: YibE/F family protein [Anaerolineae bacterium]|nr:YibE/F family protein [Anaerolineae bacterium]